MLFKNKLYFYWIFILGHILISCSQKKPIIYGPIIISDQFSTEKINDKVLIGSGFKQEYLSKPNLIGYIDSTFKPNTTTASVMLGNAYYNNPRWVAFKLINASPQALKLVVETVHIRCDGLKGYIIMNDSVKKLGHIVRKTPLTERPFPFREFAFPFTVVASDTIQILLQSERYAGYHELIITLSNEKEFINNVIKTNFNELFQILFFGALFLLIVTVSIMFSQKKLLITAAYVGIMAILYLNAYYLTDSWQFPTFLKLNQNNLGQFILLTSIFIYQIFIYQLFENFIIRKRLFFIISGILYIFATLIILGILFTTEIHAISGSALALLTGLSGAMGFCYSVFGLFKAKNKLYPILIFILFLPGCLTFFVNIISKTLILDHNYFNNFFILIVISIIVLTEFKRELVSRQNADKSLEHLNQTLEGIRKSEVENIGRNLHDQVGNTLASALGYLNMKSPKIEVVKNLVFDSINEIRFLSHNLVKNEDKPLTEKMEELVARFNDFSKIQFNYSDFSNGNINHLEPLKLQNIYMILQEIFNNIIKHSSAKEAFIQIFEQEKIFQISIEDDGIGIKSYIENKGIGLINIHKRAELSNLKLTIESTSEGTNTIIEIPKT